LLAGQEIITRNGIKNIEDITTNDYVLTHKGRFRKVKTLMKRKYSGKLYEVFINKLKRPLKLTEEHPILIANNKLETTWIKPGNIDVGTKSKKQDLNNFLSYVCLPKVSSNINNIDISKYMPEHLDVQDGKILKISKLSKHDHLKEWDNFEKDLILDSDLAYLLGMYCAEGSINTSGPNGINGQVIFTLNINENSFVENILIVLKDKFNIIPTVYSREEKSIKEIVFCNIPLAFLLSGMCGIGSKNKKIPFEIFESSVEIQDAFINGLLDGDGKKHPTQSILRVSSRDLAWGFRTLLVNRNVWCNVSFYNHQDRETYQVSYNHIAKYRRCLSDKNYIYKPIKNIIFEEVSDIDVYNFEVEEDNSYVSDFILHNCEFYFTDDGEQKNSHYHLVLIAKNQNGFNNLCNLSRYSYVTGFYKKPRIDWQSLSRFSEDLVCTSACIFGLPQQQFLNNEVDGAMDSIKSFQKLFGEDYYLEVANHGLEDEDQVRSWFREVGRDLGIKLVAATDSHYLKAGDKELHNIFKQLAYNSVGEGADDGFPGSGYHILSFEEMQEKFLQEELDTTLEIADKCNINFEFKGYNLPKAETPEGVDSFEHMTALAVHGLKEKGLHEKKIYRDRLDFELELLHLTDLEDYFLIVADYMKWCRENGVPVGPGRGSAAGSLVSYCLGITGVDPIKYDLLFARCVNVGRSLQFDFGI